MGGCVSNSLEGLRALSTYRRLLQIADQNGLDGTLRPVLDGAGDASPLQLSTQAVNVQGILSIQGQDVNERAPISRLGIVSSALVNTSPGPRPFVLVVEGQSNAALGSANGGSTTIDQSGGGIWIYSSLSGGSGGTMVQAAYGTAPLTGSTRLLAVAIANGLRAAGLVAPERPIWIGNNAVGGIPISDWDGTSSVRWLGFTGMMTTMSALWTSADPLMIDHRHWQQGEYEGAFVTPNSSQAAYMATWDRIMLQYRAHPNVGRYTTFSVGEIGRWRAYTTSDTATLVWPANQRNDALRAIGSGNRDPAVTLVSSAGLANNGTLAVDTNHFSGTSINTLGARVAAAYAAMRAGNGNIIPVSDSNLPVVSGVSRTFSTADGTVVLGSEDVERPFNWALNAATIRLPQVVADGPVFGTIDVVGTSTIFPPNSAAALETDLIVGAVGASASIASGKYLLFITRGRWALRLLDITPTFRVDIGAIITGQSRTLTSVEARSGSVRMSGAVKLTVPPPVAGATLLLTCNSLTGGNPVIAFNINGISLASGGSGYAVSDVLTLPLGAATGDPATVTVTAVDGGGAITAFTVTTRGFVTSATAPTTPASATGGTGTGASFNLTMTTAQIIRQGRSVGSITMTAVEQTIVLASTGTSWRVVADTCEQQPIPAVFTPTTGGTVAIAEQGGVSVINPAGTLANLTITLPASPLDGDRVRIKFQQTITALAWTVAPVPTRASATQGQQLDLVYSAALGAWV